MKETDNEINVGSSRSISINPNKLANHPVLGKIEEFVKHYYNGDYTIKPEAFSVPCSCDSRKASLGNFLTGSLSNYLIAKGNQNIEQLCEVSGELITWITQLYGTNLIIESPSLLSRLQESDEQNRQLKEIKMQLEKKLSECQKDNEELHKWLDKFGDRSTIPEQ
jgi:hypothetical protein